jgi:hypothetical protein
MKFLIASVFMFIMVSAFAETEQSMGHPMMDNTPVFGTAPLNWTELNKIPKSGTSNVSIVPWVGIPVYKIQPVKLQPVHTPIKIR